MPPAPGVFAAVLISFRRSKNTSAFASGLLAMEYSTPSCSPTNRRSLLGQLAMSSGWLIFTFGKTRTALNGGGGSGEPTTFDVVHGTRAGGVFTSDFFGSSAGAGDRITRANAPRDTTTAATQAGNRVI